MYLQTPALILALTGVTHAKNWPDDHWKMMKTSHDNALYCTTVNIMLNAQVAIKVLQLKCSQMHTV